jgi:uncharacterized coiled-coil DUF342 family protein
MRIDEMVPLIDELREQVTILKAERDEHNRNVDILSAALLRACDEATNGYSRGWDGLDQADANVRIDDLRRLVKP